MKLSEQIRKHRKLSNLTQEGLAKKLHTTRQSVSKWEQGSLEPNIQTLNDLAKLFGISLDHLVNGEEEVKKHKIEKRSSEQMNFWSFAAEKWWVIILIIFIICGTLAQIFS